MMSTETKQANQWHVEDHGPNCGNSIRFEVYQSSVVTEYELIASIEVEEAEQAEAHARLIAAAPELLTVARAVQALNKSTEGRGALDFSINDLMAIYDCADIALAKVKGGRS